MVSFDEIHEKVESLSMAEKHIIDHIPERVVHRSVLSCICIPETEKTSFIAVYSDISHLDSHVLLTAFTE